MHFRKTIQIVILLAVISPSTFGQKFHYGLKHQLSAWSTINSSSKFRYELGGRYLPVLSLSDSLKNNCKIDLELSGNVYGSLDFEGKKYSGSSGQLKPYRCWVRYATPRFEVRLGLQKINFGSASMLRPLMWFDKLDFRDPLQLTDGVYAVLGRYYFRNNSNIWLWSLYGNKDPVGWEPVPSVWKVPEFGGRFQQPVPGGEVALSYHHRQADYATFFDTIPSFAAKRFPENKLAFDGKWDLGIGLWFEYVVKQNNKEISLINPWETYFNLGADYTFALGNGLNVMTEFFRYNNTGSLFRTGTSKTFVSMSLNYPFGLMNNATAVIYYNQDAKEWSRFISFQRKYDYWSFYLLAFWNPDTPLMTNLSADKSLYAGKGIQFMTVVNF